jgi:hypothetical protein
MWQNWCYFFMSKRTSLARQHWYPNDITLFILFLSKSWCQKYFNSTSKRHENCYLGYDKGNKRNRLNFQGAMHSPETRDTTTEAFLLCINIFSCLTGFFVCWPFPDIGDVNKIIQTYKRLHSISIELGWEDVSFLHLHVYILQFCLT